MAYVEIIPRPVKDPAAVNTACDEVEALFAQRPVGLREFLEIHLRRGLAAADVLRVVSAALYAGELCSEWRDGELWLSEAPKSEAPAEESPNAWHMGEDKIGLTTTVGPGGAR